MYPKNFRKKSVRKNFKIFFRKNMKKKPRGKKAREKKKHVKKKHTSLRKFPKVP
jgi:hypothetical protein